MPRHLVPRVLGLMVLASWASAALAGDLAATMPAPRAYPHAGFTATAFGAGPRSYWIFEPTGPTPEVAPVVVFHHGWLAVNPGVYGAWIEHLARSGRVVIFPRYQADFTMRPQDFLPNSASAVRDALDVLRTGPGRVRPDLARFAVVGHSAGGNLSAQMAASALELGLPIPRAVVCVCPGEVKPLREPDLSKIPASTLLVVAATDADRVVGDCRAREIYAAASAIPPERKEFVLFRSDRRGPVPLIADHFAPTAGLARLDSGEGLLRTRQMGTATTDILDRHGFWRMTDLTLDAAFAGLDLDVATEAGSLFRDLGRWSDGRVVTPPISGDDLAAIPRVFPTNGVRVLPWSPDEFKRMLSADRP